MNTEELQSKVFALLRFPLSVGIVMIHVGSLGGGIDNQYFSSISSFSKGVFSYVLGSVAVPLFFFMSGFLFFYNVNFTKKVYVKKLKSRSKSLLIPYLFWNLLALIALSVASNFTQSINGHVLELNLNNIVEAIFGRFNGPNSFQPRAGQFWFVRDLMVLCLLSPVVYFLLKKTRWYLLIPIAICWVFGLLIPFLGIRCMRTDAWLFFMFGAYFSIYKKNVVVESSKFGRWIYGVYALLGLSSLIIIQYVNIELIRKIVLCLLTFVGIVCWIKFATFLIDKRSVKQKAIFATSSFFIFAVHDPFVRFPLVEFFLKRYVNPSSDIALTISYFVISFLVVTISLLIFAFLKRIAPRFTVFITGGRG